MPSWIKQLANQLKSQDMQKSEILSKMDDFFGNLSASIEESINEADEELPDITNILHLEKRDKYWFCVHGSRKRDSQERYDTEIRFHPGLSEFMIINSDETIKTYVAILDESGTVSLKSGFTIYNYWDVSKMLVEPLVLLALNQR